MSSKLPSYFDCATNASIARRVPFELLTIVFHFVGPSTAKDPYPYLPLSWVCRLWRAVVHDNPRFWTVIYINQSMYATPIDLAKEIISRPGRRALDIIMYADNDDSKYTTRNWYVQTRYHQPFQHPVREQIRSLLLTSPQEYALRGIGWPGVPFPRLERLTGTCELYGSSDSNNIDQLAKVIVASPNLRYAELPYNVLLSLHSQGLSHHLSRIEWLDLRFFGWRALIAPGTISIIHDVLEKMPSLQIFALTWMDCDRDPSSWQASEAPPPVIMLPKLRILSLNSRRDEMWTFEAPNLDHLSVLNFGLNSQPDTEEFQNLTFHNLGLLKQLDFSQICNALVGLHAYMLEDDIDHSSVASRSVACISTSNHPQLDCLSFKHFHEDGLKSQPSMDDYLDLPSKNCFHIPLLWKSQFALFGSILSRAINLVELTLDYGGITNDPLYFSFLESILNVVNRRITSLNLMQGRSFAAACSLLERRAPRLERLLYHNAVLMKATAFLPKRLQKLQNARLKASFQPLKILELRNFPDVLPERVQAIADLGVQFIQTPQ